MSNAFRSLLATAPTAALGLVLALCTACGDSSGSTGGAGTPASTDTAGAADAASRGDARGLADAATVTAEQCQNETDLKWLKSEVKPGMTGRELAREAAGDCGLGCLNHPAPDQCAIKCMTQDKGVQLSSGCAGCYGGIVICTIEKCLAKCIDDAQAQICKDCQESKGCNTTFYACTGNLD